MRPSVAAVVLLLAPVAGAADQEVAPSAVRAFVESNCADCHTGPEGEGGFDVTALPDAPTLGDAGRWDRVHDRVAAGEMPPSDSGELPAADRDRFLSGVTGWLTERQSAEAAESGRTAGRRLTAAQLERTLHSVLGIDVPLTPLLPEDQRRHGFTTVSEGRSLSHHDLADHLEAVDAALDEAFRRASTADGDGFRERFTAEELSRSNRKKRSRDPMFEGGAAMVWQTKLVYVGRLPVTQIRNRGGWRRLTFEASAVNAPPGGLWCTVRTGRCSSSAPAMTDVGLFLATPGRDTYSFEAWLPEDHMFEVRPADSRLKQGKTPGGQIGYGEMPKQNVAGLAIHSAVLEGVHAGPDDDGVRALLYGPDMTFDRKRVGEGKYRRTDLIPNPSAPKAALGRLMRDFADRAFRRPTEPAVVLPHIERAAADLAAGASFEEALRGGLRSLLCSPRFLYHIEEPGALDGPALAARVSYAFTGGPPDAELARLARSGAILRDGTLREQTERLLSGETGRRFVEDYAAQWLDLSELEATEVIPLYAGFDDTVRISMRNETRGLLAKMIAEDLSVTHVVDADFALVNARLADHYGLSDGPGARFTPRDGAELKPVPLPENSPRGGLLTQGAVLKVTADGANTSPVLRGVWVSERLLGMTVPPPPENVPAVEPDTRGATTIREQLEQHRSDPNCASCHRKVDPVGFALESFDPGGAFRTDYTRFQRRKIVPRAPVDPSYELPTGERFGNVAEFQALAAADPAALARNFVAQFLTYATGAPPTFADRAAIAAAVERAEPSGYGVRTLLIEAVLSDLFRSK